MKKQETESKQEIDQTEVQSSEMSSTKEMEQSTEVEPLDSELAERVAVLLTQVTQTVQEMLDLSEGELQTFMEQMGITAVDLLNPSTLQNLVLLVKEQEPVMLLTDEQLLSTVSQLTEQVEDLLKNANISPKELMQVVEHQDFGNILSNYQDSMTENVQESDVITENVEEVQGKETDSFSTEVKEATIEFQTVTKGDETKQINNGCTLNSGSPTARQVRF